MKLEIIGVPCAREFRPGDDLVEALAEALDRAGGVQAGDVLVVTQKVISKAEGRVVQLQSIQPGDLAQSFADAWHKDPRVVELALREARRVVRMVRGVLITQTHQGFICANSGVDRSNVDEGEALLLPVDPDASAERIRAGIAQRTGLELPVVVTDTFGRPWRRGQTNVAIGIAGAAPMVDYRGQPDALGRELKATEIAVADEIASAAELVMNKSDGIPFAIVRGYRMPPGPGSGKDLVRETEHDLFL